jgi:hypothetical protein
MKYKLMMEPAKVLAAAVPSSVRPLHAECKFSCEDAVHPFAVSAEVVEAVIQPALQP